MQIAVRTLRSHSTMINCERCRFFQHCFDHSDEHYAEGEVSAIPIDSSPAASNNWVMSTETPTTDRHQLEDLIAKRMKGERDPEETRQACERMDRMREEIRKWVGTVDFAVDSIREHRDR
ncbi:MAG: hypothetical protein JWP89_593 [Schlesneria sp.]|nr:hypothetical protein [Schlesneria sp.]